MDIGALEIAFADIKRANQGVSDEYEDEQPKLIQNQQKTKNLAQNAVEENKHQSTKLSRGSSVSGDSGVDSYNSGIDSIQDLEEKANLFIDSIQKNFERPEQQEVRTKEQLLMDDETLETLKRIRIQSLSNGDEIDSQLRKVFVGGLPQNLP